MQARVIRQVIFACFSDDIYGHYAVALSENQ